MLIWILGLLRSITVDTDTDTIQAHRNLPQGHFHEL